MISVLVCSAISSCLCTKRH